MTEETLKKAKELEEKIKTLEKKYNAFMHYDERKDKNSTRPYVITKFYNKNNIWLESIHYLDDDEQWFIDLIATKVKKKIDDLKEELAAL